MFRLELGLALYLLGNLIILAQNWLGDSERGKHYRFHGKWAYLFVFALIASFYIGAAVGIVGLVILLFVYWWLPILVFLACHPIFRKMLINSGKV